MTMCSFGYFVGLFVISTSVNSFVLLTANFDDLKKIAQNFVNEAVAAKLTGLFTKLNDNKGITISADEELNGNQRKGEQDAVVDLRKDSGSDEKSISNESLSSENLKYKPKSFKNKHKTRFESKTKGPNKQENEKNGQIIKKKNSTDNLDNKKAYVKEEYFGVNNKKYKIISKIKKKAKSDKAFRFDKSRTAEERNEFDESDSGNRLKSEAIATSGPVALKKVNVSKSIYRNED